MKLRTAIKILRSNNDYWWRQVDDYDIRGIKNTKVATKAPIKINIPNNSVVSSPNLTLSILCNSYHY